MKKEHREAAPPKRPRSIVSYRSDPDSDEGDVLADMLFCPRSRTTRFCVRDGEGVRDVERLDLASGEVCVPYSGSNNLLTHRVVLFPSSCSTLEVDVGLREAVRAFIHRYVDVSELFEEIASHYVLLSWIYDDFDALPYLRVRGDYGSGKSRFLSVLGALCYLPIFASGASTVSPLFRLLDTVRGTLVIDEADFRFSDAQADIVKILNNGNAKGFPVLRSESTPQKEFNPKAFLVYGPKLIATRKYFEDEALESRCFTEEMGQRPLRADIPRNLPRSFEAEALDLRNRLLGYRMLKAGSFVVESDDDMSGVEPRLSQLFRPLLATATGDRERQVLLSAQSTLGGTRSLDRSSGVEAEVLTTIFELIRVSDAPVSLSAIASRFSSRFGADVGGSVTPRYIGGILRRRLFVRPQKSRGVFIIPRSAYGVLRTLGERYGVEAVDNSKLGAPLGISSEDETRGT